MTPARPSRSEAFDLASQAIGLFVEYRGVHGHDGESARRSAALEVAEGASLTPCDLGLTDDLEAEAEGAEPEPEAEL
jgi:hypothetical protein